MLGNKLINTNAGGGCTNTVDLYNPFPDGGGVALYQLNGDATDVSGNYDGTATNVTYGAGQFGQAGVFNNGYIQIPNLTIPTTATISIWAKATSGYLFSSQTSAYRREQPNMYWDGTNNRFACLSSRGDSSSWLYTGTLTAGAWHNIVLVQKSDGTAYLYANGELQDSNTTTAATYTPIAGFTIGALYEPEDGGIKAPYTGEIDQVRIFNRALRPYEVEALYTEEYCTPTIVPSEHFNTVTYTGNATARSITGVGFQPDFTWIKNRSAAQFHNLIDSVRGNTKLLYSNATNAEDTTTNHITSFDADGFSLGTATSANGNGNGIVSWNFKAGGAAVTNTDGTITSQVSANTDSGFSVVTWTGNGVNGATVGHGLTQTPDLIITKGRSGFDPITNWCVYHSSLGAGTSLFLNSTTSQIANGNWNGTSPTSSVFSLAGNDANGNGTLFVAYCFAEVEGFSNFGSYVGNGSSSGPTVITGFEPAFLLIKQSSASGEYWNIWDNKRSVENPRSDVLFPNLSNAESSNQSWSDVQFLENGFQVTPTVMTPTNQNGATYIYMAFAADPTAVEPSLADSFNTVLYSGNNSTQSITGVGFQPDFLWIKSRNATYNNLLQDSVRGAGSSLYSNLTYSGDDSGNYYVSSFDSNGFTMNVLGGSSQNNTGTNYVAWCWKGAEIPAINSNGSITSIVSANPAAGFSIVSYTGSVSQTGTVGHGLGIAPNVIFVKNRNNAYNWVCYFSELGASDYLSLNETYASSYPDSRMWNDTAPTSDVFTASNGNFIPVNENGSGFIAYCFAEVAGFSKFGSYTGNGSTNGPTITTGFRPLFIMVKASTIADNWTIWDNVRDTGDNIDQILVPNTSGAETADGFGRYDITLSDTGFQIKRTDGQINASGQTYIYMAFANQF